MLGDYEKLTTKKFIERATQLHNNKFDYSLVEYKTAVTKIKIICPEHGVFEQTPNSHLRGYGCSKCKIITNEKFIKNSKVVHGDKYDYSLTDYKNSNDKIKIICPIHGIFEQAPRMHLSGQNCPKCNIITTGTFIEKSSKIHENRYDYSLVDYKNNNTKVKIICNIHGIFEQTPANHMSCKNDCPKCASLLSNTKEFIIKSNIIHENKYDYSLVDYKNNRTKVKIICLKHGVFEQLPSSHLNKQGCPICNESKGEDVIRKYLKTNNIRYKRQKTFDGCSYKYPLRFDFYLIKHNICIEYDGMQHFKPIEYWGGVDTFNYILMKDEIKNEYCKNNNIKLIRIKYDENIIEKLTNQLVFSYINIS